MVLGLLGIGYGFYKAPKTIEESNELVAASPVSYTHLTLPTNREV